MKAKCKCKVCKKVWKVKRTKPREIREIKRNRKIVICNECDDLSNQIMFGQAVYYK